ncbi:SDR family NAD(P)-dependent oxidoreductase [Actinophytocola sp.]|jgi:3-oxoacyl-[acyl-carrier protein] reductase|uniref:SDR family NAD(P)-dependent oxidoreductase n=1 Tax=Actinophytocola sp. TaxID=1872138 RepID=UPI002EDAE1EA
MNTRLAGRTALVTGAASGIGAAIAVAFAEEGADVSLVDRDVGDHLAEVVRRCEKFGATVHTEVADVSDEDAVHAAFAATVARFGRLDVLVNNAGIITESRVADMPAALFDHMLAVHLRGTFLCCRAALPTMRAQRHGRIINISSQLALKGAPLLAHYCAAKAGILGLTKALAREVAADGITVNAIAPGPIETPLADDLTEAKASVADLPLGRFGQPHEVAPTAVLLAGDPSGNLYTGQTLGPNSGDVMP